MSKDGKLLLQKKPAAGTENEVNNGHVHPPEGSSKVLEVHNPPPLGAKSLPHFSHGDMVTFLFHNKNVIDAVVSAEGTIMLIRTEQTRRKVAEQLGNDRWNWVDHGNNIANKFTELVPNDTSEERYNFTKHYAQEYGTIFLFKPARTMQYRTEYAPGFPRKKNKIATVVAARLATVSNLLPRSNSIN